MTRASSPRKPRRGNRGKKDRPPKNRQAKVEVVQKITSDFPQPDTKFFNSGAVNPTQLIQIGQEQNPQPFGSD